MDSERDSRSDMQKEILSRGRGAETWRCPRIAHTWPTRQPHTGYTAHVAHTLTTHGLHQNRITNRKRKEQVPREYTRCK